VIYHGNFDGKDVWADLDCVFIVDMRKATPKSHEVLGETGEWDFESVLEVTANGFNGCEPHGASKLHHEIYAKITELLFEWQNLVFNNECLMKKIRVRIIVDEVR